MKIELHIEPADIMALAKIFLPDMRLPRQWVIKLIDCSDNKIMAIKTIRNFYPAMGLKAAKCDFCDRAPITLPPLDTGKTIQLAAELSKWAKIEVVPTLEFMPD